MEKVKYFRIRNWEKYQHPDTKRYPGPLKWIRFETSILDCDKTAHLSTHDRLTWILLLAFSGRTQNKMKQNETYIRKRLGLSRRPNLALFEELGLIESFEASAEQAPGLPTLHNGTRRDRTVDRVESITPKHTSKRVSNVTQKYVHPAQNFVDRFSKPKPKTFDEMRLEKNLNVAEKFMGDDDES